MCGGGCAWFWPDGRVGDAFGLTGGFPSEGSGGVVSGGVSPGWSGVVGFRFLRRRVRRVFEVVDDAAMSAASVWAARPNTRQDALLRLPSFSIMPLTPSTGLRPA